MTYIGNIFTIRKFTGDKTLIREFKSKYIVLGIGKLLVDDETIEEIIADPNEELSIGDTCDVYIIKNISGIPFWDEKLSIIFITKDKLIESLANYGYNI